LASIFEKTRAQLLQVLKSIKGHPPPTARGEAWMVQSFLFKKRIRRSAISPACPASAITGRKEADRLKHHNFRRHAEHLLLGIIKLGPGHCVQRLAKDGIGLGGVRAEIEKQVGPGPDTKAIGNIPYTPRVKKVLSLAIKEAKELNHTYIGTEHILLGLMREGDGVATRVLASLDVYIDRTRQEILKELDPNFEGAAANPI